VLAPYTIFNETRLVPVKVWYRDGIDLGLTEWDAELWVERGEDWYALESMRGQRVRIIEREIWLRSTIVDAGCA
jgi:hypothetical protein